MQQMSPMSLVTHGGASQAAHRLMGAPSVGQMPNLMSHEIEQRMMEYIKLFQPQQNRAQSPDMNTADAMNALEMSRVALWRKMYGNSNGSPPASIINPAGSPGSTESSRFNNHAFPDHGKFCFFRLSSRIINSLIINYCHPFTHPIHSSHQEGTRHVRR